MGEREIDAVVFDLGGVLLDWDPRYLYRRLFTDHAEMEDFLAHVCTSAWHHAHDLGLSTEESCRELATEHPGYRDMIMAWSERGEEMLRDAFTDTVAVLRDLKGTGMPCYALSNMERETYPVREARFPFMSWFDGAVISGFEGVAKPDTRIFEILLDRFDLRPESTVFVDDKASNVSAASALGIVALPFTSAARLRDDLTDLGL
jgi:2-haloacid dehalogenase